VDAATLRSGVNMKAAAITAIAAVETSSFFIGENLS
jgi:hypothetical protein